MMDFPPDTERFFKVVWEIVRQIPAGTVGTYGQIASMIPVPVGVEPEDYEKLGPKWVGKAMNAVSFKDEPSVPWQRVINGQGGISLPAGSEVATKQRQRLEAEGIAFDRKDRIDLNQYGWDGPPPEWIRSKGLYPPRAIRKPPTETPGQLKLF